MFGDGWYQVRLIITQRVTESDATDWLGPKRCWRDRPVSGIVHLENEIHSQRPNERDHHSVGRQLGQELAFCRFGSYVRANWIG